MKIGTRICHIHNAKKHGVVVRDRGDQLLILWDEDNGIPRFHPRDFIRPIEEATSIPDATGFATDEEDEDETEDSPGVSELSLEIGADADEAEEDDSNSEIVEPEVIGE